MADPTAPGRVRGLRKTSSEMMMTAMRLTVFATACVTGCTEDSAKKAHLFETRSEVEA